MKARKMFIGAFFITLNELGSLKHKVGNVNVGDQEKSKKGNDFIICIFSNTVTQFFPHHFDIHYLIKKSSQGYHKPIRSLYSRVTSLEQLSVAEFSGE